MERPYSLEWLKANKSKVIAAKKRMIKYADGILGTYPVLEAATKSQEGDVSVIRPKLIINTTNLMDSHDDVHLNGIWNKSLKEQGRGYLLLQEHRMDSFKHVIADDVPGSAEDFTFKDLGANYEGTTQALVFQPVIEKDRNAYMFNEYLKGRVRNHSVGMQYVKFELALNDPSEEAEYAAWTAHVDKIANRDRAESLGYFFAVHEAKVVEGSAVPAGSNHITPTYSLGLAVEDTSKGEPAKPDTTSQDVDLLEELRNVKFKF